MATYSDPTIVQLGEHGKTQLGSILTLIAGIVALVGAAGFFAMTYMVKSQVTDTEAKLVTATAERATYDATAKDLVALDQTSKNLHSIFDTQKQWDKVLGTIEQRMYRNMAITSIQFTEKGDISFTGYTNTFEDYAKIMSSLTDANGQLYFSVVKPTAVSKIKLAPNTKPLPGSAPDNTIAFTFNAQLTPRVLSTVDVPALADLLTAAGVK